LEALPLARFAVEPDDLRAPDALDPEPEDFARVEGDFFAELPLDRLAVELEPEVFRAPLDRPELLRDADDEEPELALALPSIDHLPDITRCAASATASAISEPSLVALETTLLAACEAVSAASSPASRIFLRAAGLAAIAAAAAVSPAASISLLIAAFASWSTVLSFEREREDELEPDLDEPEPDLDELEREEVLRADFAIALSPCVAGKTL
jgi:hypothetical protein